MASGLSHYLADLGFDSLQEMVGLAMDAAGKFVRVSMDDRTKNALIEETLAEIGENTWLS